MASILPSVKGSIRTHNETSFVIGYGDAQALVLDGLALTGEKRKEKFDFAEGRARTALSYTNTPEEEALVRQFLSYLAVARLRRWDI